jgi:hypothetical protein
VTVWRAGVKLRGRLPELQGFIAFGCERVPQGHLSLPCVHCGLVVRLHDGLDMGLMPYLPIMEKLLVRDYLLIFSSMSYLPLESYMCSTETYFRLQ